MNLEDDGRERYGLRFVGYEDNEYELIDEQLEAVSGGGSCHDGHMCPYCYQHNTRYLDHEGNTLFYMCDDCHKEFKEAF